MGFVTRGENGTNGSDWGDECRKHCYESGDFDFVLFYFRESQNTAQIPEQITAKQITAPRYTAALRVDKVSGQIV